MKYDWKSVTAIPELAAGQPQLWRMDVRGASLQTDALLRQCHDLLSADERKRSQRFKVAAAREEFIAGRGLLRWLLSAAQGCEPQDVKLKIAEHGKPYAAETGLEFNVAHSGGMVLVALGRGGRLGVDVEEINPRIEALEVAKTVFSAAEVARIEAAAEGAQRTAEFFRCWTRREAVTKADGRGLTLGTYELMGLADGSVAIGDWRYQVDEIEVAAGYRAAIATLAGSASPVLLQVPAGKLPLVNRVCAHCV